MDRSCLAAPRPVVQPTLRGGPDLYSKLVSIHTSQHPLQYQSLSFCLWGTVAMRAQNFGGAPKIWNFQEPSLQQLPSIGGCCRVDSVPPSPPSHKVLWSELHILCCDGAVRMVTSAQHQSLDFERGIRLPNADTSQKLSKPSLMVGV